MASDMKEVIAEAARKLLLEKGVRKLTVKDIVEECQITRQTFYYHFVDIPDLVQWELERNLPKLAEEARGRGSLEDGLKYIFLFALNRSSYIKKGIQSNYGEEFEQLLKQFIYRLFSEIVRSENLYQSASRFETEMLLRYHTSAVMGILKGWTEEDTKNLDSVVHEISRIMSGEISPRL